MGSTALLPIFIVLAALALHTRPRDALRSGLTAGLCLIGMSTVLSVFRTTLLQLAREIVNRFELALEIGEPGWTVAGTVTYASRISLFIIPLYLLINLLMLATRTTRTINLDIWNYWQAGFVGVMAQSLTGKLYLGVIAAAASVVILLVLTDTYAQRLQKHTGVPGISIAFGFAAAFSPVVYFFNWLMDFSPGWRKHPVTLEYLRRRVGVLADPALLGGLLGAGLSLLAGRSFSNLAQTAFSMAAVVFLLPVLGRLLADALAPIAQAADASRPKTLLCAPRLIGLSTTAGTGSAAVLLTTMVLTPMILFLAPLLPGNRLSPDADVTLLPFLMVMVVAVCRGDLIRSLITGLLAMIVMLYCGTSLAGLFTAAAVAAAPSVYESLGPVVSLCGGASPLTWLAVMLAVFGFAGVCVLVLIAVCFAVGNHSAIVGKVDPLSRKLITALSPKK